MSLFHLAKECNHRFVPDRHVLRIAFCAYCGICRPTDVKNIGIYYRYRRNWSHREGLLHAAAPLSEESTQFIMNAMAECGVVSEDDERPCVTYVEGLQPESGLYENQVEALRAAIRNYPIARISYVHKVRRRDKSSDLIIADIWNDPSIYEAVNGLASTPYCHLPQWSVRIVLGAVTRKNETSKECLKKLRYLLSNFHIQVNPDGLHTMQILTSFKNMGCKKNTMSRDIRVMRQVCEEDRFVRETTNKIPPIPTSPDSVAFNKVEMLSSYTSPDSVAYNESKVVNNQHTNLAQAGSRSYKCFTPKVPETSPANTYSTLQMLEDNFGQARQLPFVPDIYPSRHHTEVEEISREKVDIDLTFLEYPEVGNTRQVSEKSEGGCNLGPVGSERVSNHTMGGQLESGFATRLFLDF